jgi:molybdate transport system substrate-binding protein
LFRTFDPGYACRQRHEETMIRGLASPIALAWLALTVPTGAQADEIKVLTSNGTSAIVRAIGDAFTRQTGHTLKVKIDVAVLLQKEIEAGEAFDVAVLTRSAVDALVASGAIDATTRTDIARSGIGVAVRSGTRKPDIATVAAFRQTVGGSGLHFIKMVERLGIADAVRAKAKTQSGGAVGELVARGEAELAVQQISELLPVEGIDLIGPFPSELQLVTLFTTGMSARSQHPDAAKALIRFFTTPAGLEVIRVKGMEPPGAAP